MVPRRCCKTFGLCDVSEAVSSSIRWFLVVAVRHSVSVMCQKRFPLLFDGSSSLLSDVRSLWCVRGGFLFYSMVPRRCCKTFGLCDVSEAVSSSIRWFLVVAVRHSVSVMCQKRFPLLFDGSSSLLSDVRSLWCVRGGFLFYSMVPRRCCKTFGLCDVSEAVSSSIRWFLVVAVRHSVSVMCQKRFPLLFDGSSSLLSDVRSLWCVRGGFLFYSMVPRRCCKTFGLCDRVRVCVFSFTGMSLLDTCDPVQSHLLRSA